MDSVFTMPINHCSFSSYCSSSLSSPTPLQSSAASFSSFPSHGWFSAIKFMTRRKSEKNSLLALEGIRIFTHISIQCTTAITVGSLISDTGVKLFLLFREIGIHEKETELLLDMYPALAFMPFESIRTRVQSLQSLGLNGLTLSRLVTKRPDVLTAEEIDPLICFLRNELGGKIEPAQLERFLNATEPRFFLGFQAKVRLLMHHGIPQEKLAHVLNNVNLTKALCLKSVDEIERMISYLNQFGGLNLIIRRPAFLAYDLDKQLIPRIGFLLQLSGGDKDATATVLRKLPFVLAYSVEHLEDHVNFLRSHVGLIDEEIFRIVLVYPNLFSASRKRKLHPRIEFLKQCGLGSDDIYRFLIKAPLFLSLSFEENLAFKLVLLVKIGYENNTKELAMAMAAVTRTSCKNMQEVISLFLNYGLTCKDILAMSKKHPQILQYNHESLEAKMDYLIEEMGRDVGELLAFPAFLGYKLDGRIKHRYEVKKDILGEGMSLNKLLSMSTARFSMKKKRRTTTKIQ
ncbi:unnamed protein product [Ilex paraguariensis]|uniref:Uncharacterized protein n=1 Tax=Ilex paraguariensis TaxID=185542 RepID=A0ABC8RA64_9AQUA